MTKLSTASVTIYQATALFILKNGILKKNGIPIVNFLVYLSFITVQLETGEMFAFSVPAFLYLGKEMEREGA